MWLALKKMSNNGQIGDRFRNIHVFFSKLMICCVVEFILFQLPLSFILLLSMLETEQQSYKLQSSAVHLSYMAIVIDTIINPLWLSFVSYRNI